jgi:hypothetical protein
MEPISSARPANGILELVSPSAGRIGECAARDDDSAGEVYSGFRKSAPLQIR